MIVEINEEQAEEILESATCCFSESQGGDIDFLIDKIKEAFPDLWTNYTFLERTL